MKKFSCIFGKQNPIYFGKKINKRYIWSHFLDKRIVNMYSQLEKRYFFHNALAIYSKKILKKYKFDENLAGKEEDIGLMSLLKKSTNFCMIQILKLTIITQLMVILGRVLDKKCFMTLMKKSSH